MNGSWTRGGLAEWVALESSREHELRFFRGTQEAKAGDENGIVAICCIAAGAETEKNST